MNCPYCKYRFSTLIGTDELPDRKFPPLIPILCEGCAEICMIENGTVRKIPMREMEDLKQSPVYISMLRPAQQVLIANGQRKRRTWNN